MWEGGGERSTQKQVSDFFQLSTFHTGKVSPNMLKHYIKEYPN